MVAIANLDRLPAQSIGEMSEKNPDLEIYDFAIRIIAIPEFARRRHFCRLGRTELQHCGKAMFAGYNRAHAKQTPRGKQDDII